MSSTLPLDISSKSEPVYYSSEAQTFGQNIRVIFLSRHIGNIDDRVLDKFTYGVDVKMNMFRSTGGLALTIGRNYGGLVLRPSWPRVLHLHIRFVHHLPDPNLYA